MQKNEILPSSLTIHKSKLKMNENLIRPESMKLLEENTRRQLHDIGLGSDFLDMIPKAQGRKTKVNKYYITTSCTCSGVILFEGLLLLKDACNNP